MFLELKEYKFAPLIEASWQELRGEFDSIPADRLIHWPEHELYDFGWRAFPLFALGQKIDGNAKICPQTTGLLEAVPELVNAGFSVFAAGTHVHPHVGYTSTVYRFHLGLRVPPQCGLKVANETRCWEEGKLLAFDDMVEHSAWNGSDQDRAILLFDVQRPGTALEVTPSAMRAVQDYLDLLKAQTEPGA